MFSLNETTSNRTARGALICALIIVLFAHASFASSIGAALAVQSEEITIPDGAELTVVTTEEISSKTATEGDPLTFKVEDDLVINNHVAIAKGTLVKGTIASAEKSGRLGKGGKLGIRVESTTAVDGQKIKLRASQGKQGDDKTGTTIALVVLFGVFGFLKKGSEAKIKPGTKIKVYTDEEKKLHVKGGVV